MTHTDTESTDIMMRECRDLSPIATKTKTNTTKKETIKPQIREARKRGQRKRKTRKN
jgi:hypothetical protein